MDVAHGIPAPVEEDGPLPFQGVEARPAARAELLAREPVERRREGLAVAPVSGGRGDRVERLERMPRLPRRERDRLEATTRDGLAVHRVLLRPARASLADGDQPIGAAPRGLEQRGPVEDARGVHERLDHRARRRIVQARQVLEARREPAPDARSPGERPGAVVELRGDEQVEAALGRVAVARVAGLLPECEKEADAAAGHVVVERRPRSDRDEPGRGLVAVRGHLREPPAVRELEVDDEIRRASRRREQIRARAPPVRVEQELAGGRGPRAPQHDDVPVGDAERFRHPLGDVDDARRAPHADTLLADVHPAAAVALTVEHRVDRLDDVGWKLDRRCGGRGR